MKDFIKRGLVVLLAMMMLFVCLPQRAEASEKGSESNPVNLGKGGSVKTTWSGTKDDFYVKFKMAKQGYATITIPKKKDSKGRSAYFSLYLYDTKGKLVWDCLTQGQVAAPGKNFICRVGLKKGTYKLKISPDFSYGARLSATISVKAKVSNYWEIESNETFAKATTLKLNKKYNGVYGDNYLGLTNDYLKVKLAKGRRYTIVVGNSKNLFADTTICKVYDPKKKEMNDINSVSVDAGSLIQMNGTTTIQATRSGFHYIRFYNEFGYTFPGAQYTIKVIPN